MAPNSNCNDLLHVQAYELQQAGKQYIVKDNEIVLVDENTGRLKAITRYQDGMHQVRAAHTAWCADSWTCALVEACRIVHLLDL